MPTTIEADESRQSGSEKRLQLLLDALADHAIYMLDPGGRVTNWNAGARRVKGYTATEVIGEHYSRFYTQEDQVAGIPERALQAAARDGRVESEGWRVRKDGTRFWAAVVLEAIRRADGTLLGFAKITRDITERHTAQLALQKAQEQLAYAQKMEALGKLTGGVAHDFNNLLMIVSGHASLLKRLVADNPRGLRAVEAIELATQRGENLTRRLLTFSRLQRLKPEAIDLSSRVAAFRTMLASSLPPKVELVTHVGDVWPIEVDIGELELALINLVLNARDAMPEGGLVSVTAQNISLQRGQLDLDLAGDFVAMTVGDTGAGIPADILPKVFDPFFTTKSTDRGTGLGLSQVYGFSHQSGGSVRIDSHPGRGCRVTLYLPRAARVAAPAGEPPAVAPAGGRRVLIVEDNVDVASVSATMLEELGYRCVMETSAEAALTTLAQDTAFDLVFSDIVMTGMDGIALANAVRQRLPELPVLLTSGYSKAALAAQPDFPILRKPYQLGELRRAVARVVGQRRRAADEAAPTPFPDQGPLRAAQGDGR